MLFLVSACSAIIQGGAIPLRSCSAEMAPAEWQYLVFQYTHCVQDDNAAIIHAEQVCVQQRLRRLNEVMELETPEMVCLLITTDSRHRLT
jgi:hypothetical protein